MAFDPRTNVRDRALAATIPVTNTFSTDVLREVSAMLVHAASALNEPHPVDCPECDDLQTYATYLAAALASWRLAHPWRP